MRAASGTVAIKRLVRQFKGPSVPLAGGGGGPFLLQGRRFPLGGNQIPLWDFFKC